MEFQFLRDRANSLAFAWTINSLAYSIVYPFLPIYLHSERGYPMTTVGVIFPLMGAAIIVSPLIAGTLTDRIGVLVGVGANYILLNEIETDDLLACDFYNIKFIRFYY